MSDARSMIAKWKNNPPMSKSERDALRTKGDYPAELWYDNKSKPAASGFMTSAMTDLDDSGGLCPMELQKLSAKLGLGDVFAGWPVLDPCNIDHSGPDDWIANEPIRLTGT